MFPSFMNVLEDCGVTLDGGTFHLITETPFVSANAVTVYYLLKCLKDKAVCFIALQNTWSHYCNIANKVGINLRTKTDDGSVKVLDSFKILPHLISGNESELCFNFLTQCQEYSLKNMYMYIKNTVDQFHRSEKSVAIIIDSLNPLLYLGVELEEVDTFIQYCKNLVPNPKDILVASLSVDEVDVTSKFLATHLYHKSSVILEVKGLSTGQSKDIHGELNICTCPKDINFRSSRNYKNFQFKVEERDIKVFSRGLASKIL